MSIVQLKKITIYGCISEKLTILDELQSLGCMHLTSLFVPENLLDKQQQDSLPYEMLKYLKTCSKKLKQIRDPLSFDPAAIGQQIFHNKNHMKELQDESDVVKQKIQELTPWGNFILPDPTELAGKRFWFYIVPHGEMKNSCLQKIYAETVNKDNRFSYVVVVAEKEPDSMPGTQVKLPNEPIDALKERLDQIEFSIEDLQSERVHLTRWLDLFEENLCKLEDQAGLASASHHTFDNHPLFALQGWIPAYDMGKLQGFAKRHALALKIEDPSSEQLPPTLLENNAAIKGGEDLLSFYMTPSYALWDPSATIFFSFAIFFAMIFSDAGYAIILGAILAIFWRRLGKSLGGSRFRNVLLALTIFSFVWGVLVGSYFGVSPAAHGYLGSLKILDMSNYKVMMMLAILVGVTHIVIANIAQAWAKRHTLTAVANLGWATALIGAATAFFGISFGIVFVAIGLAAIFFFTTLEKPFWKRLLSGLMGLTRVTGMFGDVLSYLRLFALGLASASLAGVFNDLARQVYHSMSGFKILFVLLIILIGHGINFFLAVMSGFIHGLRLNFIEFFNWGLPDEGAPYKAFSKKEVSKWNQ